VTSHHHHLEQQMGTAGNDRPVKRAAVQCLGCWAVSRAGLRVWEVGFPHRPRCEWTVELLNDERFGELRRSAAVLVYAIRDARRAGASDDEVSAVLAFPGYAEIYEESEA
jgi:hypothetical protein